MPLTIPVARHCMRFITSMSRRRKGEDVCWPYSGIDLTTDRYRGQNIIGINTRKLRRNWYRMLKGNLTGKLNHFIKGPNVSCL